jgi:hypothetical protein
MLSFIAEAYNRLDLEPRTELEETGELQNMRKMQEVPETQEVQGTQMILEGQELDEEEAEEEEQTQVRLCFVHLKVVCPLISSSMRTASSRAIPHCGSGTAGSWVYRAPERCSLVSLHLHASQPLTRSSAVRANHDVRLSLISGTTKKRWTPS